ncbi:DUF3592 domain-containing protein [Dactylosporangium sucinum]|uniref:DUF3592 domain-containing protein n=1 Tax=Dactylosporangium sucinum TaxID=1424081 RepID=UPI00167D7F88|nr:DUF3592 domain-containing protein [Dactylosporangium sucinum]
MSSLNSGAGAARLTGLILLPVAVLLSFVALALRGVELLAVAAVAVALFATGLPLLVIGARNLARQRRVLRTGTPALATVVAVGDLSADPDEHQVTRIDLAIPTPAGPVAARVRQVVPPALVRLVGPGVLLPVRYDPADPSVAVVDWEHAQEPRRVGGSVAVDLTIGLLG